MLARISSNMNGNKSMINDSNKFQSVIDKSVCCVSSDVRILLNHLNYYINNQGQMVFEPKNVRYKSLPKYLKAQVKAMLAIAELGFAMNSYVVVETFNGEETALYITKTLHNVRDKFKQWCESGRRSDFIIMNCMREGYGDSWEAIIEYHER